MEPISINSLLRHSKPKLKSAYNSNKIRSYSVSIKISLPEFRELEHDLLTNKEFYIHLELSRRWGSKLIEHIDLTPKSSEAGNFLKWLQDNMGELFTLNYIKEIYGIIDKEYGEYLNSDYCKHVYEEMNYEGYSYIY